MPSLQRFKALTYIVGALVLSTIIFSISLLLAGSREITPLENIDGVPFPQVDGVQQISEQLAHADLYLNQPGLAQELELTVTFTPHDLEALYVGVRDNAFWLSYEPIQLYGSESLLPDCDLTPSPSPHLRRGEPRTACATIPLTDKLQDHDQSLDVMFFAVPFSPPAGARLSDRQGGDAEGVGASIVVDGKINISTVEAWLENRVSDETYWELHSIEAHVINKWPTGFSGTRQLAEWLFSILRRERPL